MQSERILNPRKCAKSAPSTISCQWLFTHFLGFIILPVIHFSSSRHSVNQWSSLNNDWIPESHNETIIYTVSTHCYNERIRELAFWVVWWVNIWRCPEQKYTPERLPNMFCQYRNPRSLRGHLLYLAYWFSPHLVLWTISHYWSFAN